MSESIGMLLGRRVRRIRQDKGLTLKQIEARVGVSATHISEIERGKTSPTIQALEKIAVALEVLPSHLIDLPPLSKPAILRVAERKSVLMNHGSIRLESLTDRSISSEMSIFLATIEGNGQVGGVSGHRGEEFCFVLDGFLEVIVDNVPHVLRSGDTIHFKATRPHQIRNLTHEPVHTLWAVRPKLYL
jgi:XRE family transcriptional regulator, regulator of sulfur utilization